MEAALSSFGQPGGIELSDWVVYNLSAPWIVRASCIGSGIITALLPQGSGASVTETRKMERNALLLTCHRSVQSIDNGFKAASWNTIFFIYEIS